MEESTGQPSLMKGAMEREELNIGGLAQVASFFCPQSQSTPQPLSTPEGSRAVSDPLIVWAGAWEMFIMCLD